MYKTYIVTIDQYRILVKFLGLIFYMSFNMVYDIFKKIYFVLNYGFF